MAVHGRQNAEFGKVDAECPTQLGGVAAVVSEQPLQTGEPPRHPVVGTSLPVDASARFRTSPTQIGGLHLERVAADAST